MERETKTVELGRGFKAKIVEYLEGGEWDEIQQVALDCRVSSTLKKANGDEYTAWTLKPEFVRLQRDRLLSIAVKSITGKDGKAFDTNALHKLPTDCRDRLIAAINDTIGPVDGKKDPK